MLWNIGKWTEDLWGCLGTPMGHWQWVLWVQLVFGWSLLDLDPQNPGKWRLFCSLSCLWPVFVAHLPAGQASFMLRSAARIKLKLTLTGVPRPKVSHSTISVTHFCGQSMWACGVGVHSSCIHSQLFVKCQSCTFIMWLLWLWLRWWGKKKKNSLDWQMHLQGRSSSVQRH